jgi:hypothetical protein
MNPIVQLTDPSFQTQHSGKCDLHVEILPKEIRFAVVDKGQDQLKVLYVAEITSFDVQEIAALIDAEPVLTYHFRKVKIGFHTSKFTFIPDELFQQEHVGEYAKFFSSDESDLIATDHIRSAKCVTIFAIPGELVALFQQKFHQPQFYHAANPTIEAGATWSRKNENALVLLNIQPDFFEASCYSNAQLQFYNAFPCRTADEFNYFLLNLSNNLGLNQLETDWLIAGKTDEELLARLRKYSSTVQQITQVDFIKIPESFEAVAAQQFYSLTALSLCE